MEPASIRSKNPGAMWPGPVSKKWGATKSEGLNDGTGQGNKIAYFPTFVAGICAQIDLWRGPRYRNKAFSAAIAVWSGGNHVESYIKFVLDRVPGMKRDTVISDSFLNSPMGVGFLKAQAWHEAGKRYPAPDADFVAAQKIVFGGVKPPVSNAKKAAGAIVAGTASGGGVVESGMNPVWAIVIGVAIAAAVFIVWKLTHKPESNAAPAAPAPVPGVQAEVRAPVPFVEAVPEGV
jgi:hypothetical protein